MKRFRLAFALALLALASACGGETRDPVEARPAAPPAQEVRDTVPETGTQNVECPDTTGRGGVLGSGGGKQGC